MSIEGLELECTAIVATSPEIAFRHFVERFGQWWPREYTWSRERLGSIGIGSRAGERCTETSRDGFTIDFGRTLAVDAPHRLSFAWCIDPTRVPIPDVDAAGIVTVEFSPHDVGSTRVRLAHAGFERHGDAGRGYRNAMASERGWPFILERYAASFESSAG